jgi:hypothetical protein
MALSARRALHNYDVMSALGNMWLADGTRPTLYWLHLLPYRLTVLALASHYPIHYFQAI